MYIGMAVETSCTPRDTDLVKTLKQIIELRNSSKSMVLFGKKVSVAKTEDDSSELQLSEKLPPTALTQLKGLYQQHLKRKAQRHGDALPTLALLNGIQDKESVCVKRQRVGRDHLSGSKPALSTCSPQAGLLAEAGPSLHVEDGGAQRIDSSKGAPLTVFYNGMVYVYDDIPSDKAEAIMILAESAKSSISRTSSTIQESASQEIEPSKGTFALPDLPQARKASLQRFLEKRKDRLIVKADKKMIKSAALLKKKFGDARPAPHQVVTATALVQMQ